MDIFDYDNLIQSEKIFGIEIVDNTLKVLELKKGGGGKFTVSGFGEEQFDPSAVVEGVIVKKDLISKAIKNAREQARPHRIRTRYVAVVLPDTKIFVRVVKFPAGMTKNEIKEAIEWKAKDLIAMPLEKVYWDWHRLREDEEDDDRREVEVVVSAVEKECVDSYVKTLQLLDIIPLYFDVSGNAAARFLFQDEYKKKKALMIRIDRSSTTLSLCLEGGVRYQTIIKDVIRGGYGALVDHATATLGINKEEAEELILSPKNLNKEQKEKLRIGFEVSFNGLLREINQILDFYSQTLDTGRDSKDGSSKELDGIYIFGKGAKVFYLRDFFKEKSIQISTKPTRTTFVSPMLPFISRQGLTQNMVLLGVSLRHLGFFRGLRDINLVPKSIKTRYLQRSIYSSLYAYLRLIFWNVFVIGVILVFIYMIALVYKNNVEQVLKSVENITESKANTQLREDINDINQTAGQIDLLLDTQLDWEEFFKEVSNRRGGGITYKNLFVSEDESILKAVAGDKAITKKAGYVYLVINGVAEHREDLQRYVQNMENSDIFEEVKMPISSFESSTNIEFTMYCFVNTQELKY
ncbi:pilus assembly protein PilM [Candidatus Dojkabacteria bacterium]|nr:pilus assembly protein PilM [Candidatus Dojkabacteria bacterium]